jgi:hypothetical protein
MPTLSVRDIARHRFGATGDLSINADLYGYIHRDSEARLFGRLEDTDVLPGSGTASAPTTRSLGRHLETSLGKSVDLVIFLVGHEPDFSGVVNLDDVTKIQYAIQVARDLYAQVDLSIRRIEWDRISVEDAGGLVDITSVLGAVRLTKKENGREGAIDIFWVQTIGRRAGRAPKDGPCEKHDPGLPTTMNGCVIELDEDRQFTGIAIAHEVGHYLGLGHKSDEANVMCGPVLFRERCETSIAMTEITADQAEEMIRHCMVVD